jgi:transposase-like protein
MKEIVDAYSKGETIKEIAIKFGVGQTSVWAILKHHGLKMRPRGDRRLFDVEQALKYREKGYSYRRIARILGVCHSGIYRKVSRAIQDREGECKLVEGEEAQTCSQRSPVEVSPFGKEGSRGQIFKAISQTRVGK